MHTKHNETESCLVHNILIYQVNRQTDGVESNTSWRMSNNRDTHVKQSSDASGILFIIFHYKCTVKEVNNENFLSFSENNGCNRDCFSFISARKFIALSRFLAHVPVVEKKTTHF